MAAIEWQPPADSYRNGGELDKRLVRVGLRMVDQWRMHSDQVAVHANRLGDHDRVGSALRRCSIAAEVDHQFEDDCHCPAPPAWLTCVDSSGLPGVTRCVSWWPT